VKNDFQVFDFVDHELNISI